MIFVAVKAAAAASAAATATTAAVDPVAFTANPIINDRISCATNTQLLTTATSVPMPLSSPHPPPALSHYDEKKKQKLYSSRDTCQKSNQASL